MMPTLNRLLAIKMVASKYFGFSIKFMLKRARLLSARVKVRLSWFEREKKATSAPDTSAELTKSTAMARIENMISALNVTPRSLMRNNHLSYSSSELFSKIIGFAIGCL